MTRFSRNTFERKSRFCFWNKSRRELHCEIRRVTEALSHPRHLTQTRAGFCSRVGQKCISRASELKKGGSGHRKGHGAGPHELSAVRPLVFLGASLIVSDFPSSCHLVFNLRIRV